MNREHKYRFWLGHTKKMTYGHTLQEIGKIIPEWTDDIVPLQFVGTFNGVEVWEGDIVHAWTEEKGDRYSNPFFSGESTGVIEYSANAFCIVEDNGYNEAWINAENIEVLGNIYEQPKQQQQ